MLYSALLMWGNNPKLTLPLVIADCVTPPEEDQATAIVNMHKKFAKGHMCVSGDMLADTQTDRPTDVRITILRHHSRGELCMCLCKIQWSVSEADVGEDSTTASCNDM